MHDGNAPSDASFTPHRLIRASAGAGKTYQLATRYLSLLRLGAQPASILATTFTRKAAGEIFGRILNRLARAIESDDERRRLDDDLGREPLWRAAGHGQALTTHECQQLLDRLITSLHRVNVATLDSFFHRITRSFALELDVPLDPMLLDDNGPQAQDLRLRAIEAMLGEAAGGPEEPDELHTFVALLRRVQHDQLRRSVTQSIDDLVSELYDVYRDTDDAALWSRLDAPGFLDDAALRDTVETLQSMESELPRTKQGKPNSSWQRSFAESVQLAQLGDWDQFIAKGLPAAVANESESFSKVEITDAWRRVYQPLVRHTIAVQIDRLKRQTEGTYELLRRFDQHFTALRRQRGALLFSDLSHKLARELPRLGDDVMSDVYFRLDSQVNHLLIDEFQDTSLNQWGVLAPMVDQVTLPGESDRSAFLVGDTKQSIYGWRGGCAELFDDVEGALTERGLTSEALNVSFRSSPVVLEAVNAVFGALPDNPALTEDADAAAQWATQFQPHEPAARVADLPGHVMLRSTPAPDDGDSDEQEEDAEPPIARPHEQYVAQRIAELHAQAPHNTIGVLVRRRSAAAKLLHELRHLGIDTSGEGGHPVTDIPAVTAVLAALTLADHPGDDVARFHVATSPVGPMLGLDDASDERGARVAARDVRHRLLAEGYAETLSDWVARLAPSCDARSLARLTQLIGLAERYETDAAQPLRPGRFVDFAAATQVEEPAPATVRVMTIHAAKGLEFDAVVLPELDMRWRDEAKVLVERETPTGPVRAVYRNPDKPTRALVPTVQQAFDDYRQRQRFEDLCTLYVAMTRARQALHIYVEPRTLTAKGQRRALSRSLASVVREALRDPSREEAPAGDELLYEAGHADWMQRDASGASTDTTSQPPAVLRLSMAASGAQPKRSWRAVSPSSMEASGRVRGAELLDLSSGAARQHGTLIHAWLEKVGYVDQGEVPDDDALIECARQCAPAMREAHVRSQIAAWRKMLNEPRVQAVLSSEGADELWRERGFAVRHEGSLMRGTFDRVTVRRENGAPVAATLVDFKTDREPDETTVRRYQPQIDAYRGALAQVLGLDAARVEAKLVFVGTGDVVAV